MPQGNETDGSIEAAYKAWNGMKMPGDSADRLAFRPLYQMFTECKPRDRDTAEFLFLSQRGFYQDMAGYLKDLGFKGLITASNWTTVNNDILGPLERASYTPGDFIDDRAKSVTSSNRQLMLDYGKRVLRIDSPRAQGVVGNLKAAGNVKLSKVTVPSEFDLGAIVVVSLDGKPLETSSRMLLQAMSEERPSDFSEAPAGNGLFRIARLGGDPWLIRDMRAHVFLLRPDAKSLIVTALDSNGTATDSFGSANHIRLRPDSVYYLIESGDIR